MKYALVLKISCSKQKLLINLAYIVFWGSESRKFALRGDSGLTTMNLALIFLEYIYIILN